MEEAEKMRALKKAYAEIILNTAKEAAARLMVSERKAQQCNYDLNYTKEEAFRLLVRLKQTMEFKINEVELKSVNQQRRIHELEAQLQEAEDIVTNLRGELNEVHLKLEEMAQNQMCNQSNVMEDAPFDNGCPQAESRLSEAVLASQANWICNGATNGHLVANGHSTANNHVKEHGYSGDLDLPSIIMRSKKFGLSRNGCTQRILACEGNLLNGQFSLAGDLDNLKTVKPTREVKEGEKLCITSPIGADISLIKEEKVVDTKQLEEVDKAGLKMNALNSCRKKRKRAARYLHVPNEAQSDLSDSQTSLPVSHDMHDRTDIEGKDTQLYLFSVIPSNISEMGALPKHIASVDCDDMLTEPCINDVNEDGEELSSLELIRQQNASGNALDVPASRIELEMKNSSANLDAKQMETSDGLPSPQPKDRVLKYTFQRKRKKESVISDVGSLLDQESFLRNEMAKKQNGNLEASTPCTVSVSPTDEQRIAQMARQLVSESEKNRWK